MAEDGACCLHREDKIEVGDHHGDAGQKGKPKAKATDAAAKRRSDPVDESGDKMKKHGCCHVIVSQTRGDKKIGPVSPSKGKDNCQ